MKPVRNNNFDLLKELVKARFKLRYNNSILGIIWVLMKPLLNFIILYFIFTAVIVGPKDPAYAANLFAGLIIFYLFQEGVTFGMNSLLDMANIILKVNFPRWIAIASSICMAAINFVINFFVIVIICLVTGFVPSFPGIFYFFFVILILFGLIYGITLFLSVIFIRIRDLTNVIDLAFQLLFYASAVFYELDSIGGNTGKIVHLNPIAILIDAARKGFIHNEITHLPFMAGIAVFTVILIIAGTWFFNRRVRRVAEYF